MRDYLEELLEERAESGDGETIELPRSALLTAPPRKEPREFGEQTPTEGGETGKDALTVGIADQSPEGGAKGTERAKPLASWEAWAGPQKARAKDVAGQTHKVPTYGSVEALVGKLRKGAIAAAYRATTPHSATRDDPFPSRGERGTDVAELDAAVRRDARRYDGGFELY